MNIYPLALKQDVFHSDMYGTKEAGFRRTKSPEKPRDGDGQRPFGRIRSILFHHTTGRVYRLCLGKSGLEVNMDGQHPFSTDLYPICTPWFTPWCSKWPIHGGLTELQLPQCFTNHKWLNSHNRLTIFIPSAHWTLTHSQCEKCEALAAKQQPCSGQNCPLPLCLNSEWWLATCQSLPEALRP